MTGLDWEAGGCALMCLTGCYWMQVESQELEGRSKTDKGPTYQVTTLLFFHSLRNALMAFVWRSLVF